MLNINSASMTFVFKMYINPDIAKHTYIINLMHRSGKFYQLSHYTFRLHSATHKLKL